MLSSELKSSQISKGGNTLGLAPGPTESTLKAIASRNLPFDPATGKLLDHAVELDVNRSEGHVLATARNFGHTELLDHPLTIAYLNHKWDTYVWKICLLYLVFEIITNISLALFLGVSWNWNQIDRYYNLSQEEFCNSTFSDNPIKDGWFDRLGAYVLMLIVIVVLMSFEAYYVMMTRNKFRRLFMPNQSPFSLFRILTFIILVLPLNLSCTFDLGLVDTFQWQWGIICLLMSWLHMIHILNKQPRLSIFMPITLAFTRSLLKILLYIFLIIFIFSYIFHLLLCQNDAFSSVPQSFVKTIVWLLGDLGYDDTFVSKDGPLYPILTNVFFLFFITTISAFVINLIVSDSSSHTERLRKHAAVFRTSNVIELFLTTDDLFPGLRKKHTYGFLKIGPDNFTRSHKNLLLEKFLAGKEAEMLEEKDDNAKDTSAQIAALSDQIKDLKDIVNKLVEAEEN